MSEQTQSAISTALEAKKECIHKIGFMQGRLTRVSKPGVIQEFPWNNWQNEFAIAQECEMPIMEWVFENRNWENNPLITKNGRQEICALQSRHNVQVDSVCCDYFMANPVLDNVDRSQAMMEQLIPACAEVGIQYLEIPFIDDNNILTEEKQEKILAFLNRYVQQVQVHDMFLSLEVSLTPKGVCEFLKKVDSERICINYDSGNSAYAEFNMKEEIPAYGKRIGNIHIKDCTVPDYSVPLGEGNVDFHYFFQALKDVNYQGNFILQTARGANDIDLIKKYYAFVQSYVEKYLR